jgi:hypothetical protein
MKLRGTVFDIVSNKGFWRSIKLPDNHILYKMPRRLSYKARTQTQDRHIDNNNNFKN